MDVKIARKVKSNWAVLIQMHSGISNVLSIMFLFFRISDWFNRHFHYDVTHAKVSGSCSKDRAQGRSIAGKFKIRTTKNTCNAMAVELVDHLTSIMCITEGTSSDISDNLLLSPRGHIKRQQCKSKEALFCKSYDFFYRFALGALQNFLADAFLYARFSGR